MIWLTFDMVETFHRESLAQFGGADGIRDIDLLRSAMARPMNVYAYEPDASLFRLAASYCHGIVKNHPFIDGNKRTGALAAVVFLALNDVELEFDEPEVAAAIINVASGEWSEAQLADWLQANAKP